MRDYLERTGRATVAFAEEAGLGAELFWRSLVHLVIGARLRQPVRFSAIVQMAMETGVRAMPIVTILSLAVGAMLAIQGIHTLRIFGAELQVTLGIGLGVIREFAPLMTAVLIAGRSGSALAARIGTMKINQEVDALTVMGVEPARFLVAPALFALLVMGPALTVWAMMMGMLGGGLYVSAELGMSMTAFGDQCRHAITADDIWHGVGKSILFSVLVALIGVVNGASVVGGAEGIGKATTRAVVQSITSIVIADMIFAFLTTR